MIVIVYSIRGFPGDSVVKIQLPIQEMQETQIGSPGREDPVCRGVTEPVCHSCLACELRLLSPCVTTAEARASRAATAMRGPHAAAGAAPACLIGKSLPGSKGPAQPVNNKYSYQLNMNK